MFVDFGYLEEECLSDFAPVKLFLYQFSLKKTYQI